MTTAIVELTTKLAARLDMGEGGDLVNTLKDTAFKGQVSDAQMTALLVVANQYGLNPWTKEIYAFPDKNNGIVPVVGVDGWSRIINNHPQFDGMDFEQDSESCTCRMYRKDRGRPIVVTEYMSECRRPNVGPWTSHPKRMLRHKAMIQCARLAFGYTGIYDQDEAERIAEVEINPRQARQTGTQAAEAARAVAAPADSEERTNLVADLEIVASEQGIAAYAEAWGRLSSAQRKMIGADEHERLKKVADSITVTATVERAEAGNE
ncbi:hypothetical protein OTERR_12720 [Oryzomicrobium terrae]|uniref:Phage recombination protein Bet n=1 Tax=Oryzomicrobium terrae TaxID=1735038 RepID=A0A5C1E928_9RHOO|nr:hypothetical protein OTERR_12720 [Oryzomicrobium terrae]